MSEDSSRVSMHSRARSSPRDGGSVHSSSVKSEPQSIKSDPWSIKSEPQSIKSEPRSIESEPMEGTLPGSSVGGRSTVSVKSEPVSQDLVDSYYGSHRGLSGSTRTAYGGSLVGSNRSSRALSGYTFGHTHSSTLSRIPSLEDIDAHTSSYHPRSEPRRPTKRDDIWFLRAGRTLELAKKRPGYVAETQARRRV